MSHIGKNIRRLRSQKNLTQIELAQVLDVGRTNISNWENGVSSPDIENLIAIANLFSVSIDELVTGNVPENPNLVQEPASQYNFIHLLSPFPANASLPFTYTPDWLGTPEQIKIPGVRGNVYIFQVDGISMVPTIDPGDFIGCRKIVDPNDILSGYAYVVVTEVGIYLKRLIKMDGMLEFSSDNPEYRPFTLPFTSIREVYRPIVKISPFINAPLNQIVTFWEGSIDANR